MGYARTAHNRTVYASALKLILLGLPPAPVFEILLAPSLPIILI